MEIEQAERQNKLEELQNKVQSQFKELIQVLNASKFQFESKDFFFLCVFFIFIICGVGFRHKMISF